MKNELIQISEQALVVCPATGDGMACAIILNRHLENVFNTIFLPENAVADIFDYPVVKEKKSNLKIHIAGFSFQSQVMEKREYPDRLSWYSHHFWSGNSLDFAKTKRWEIVVSQAYSKTSFLLLDHLKIEDRFTQKCVDLFVDAKTREESALDDWYYASLALRNDLYGIRLFLDPLFKSRSASIPVAKDRHPVEEGKDFYGSLKKMIENGRQHVFETNDEDTRVCVLPIPGSLSSYYRLVAGMGFDGLGAALAVVIVDGANQVLVMRDERKKFLWSIDAISNALDQYLGGSKVMLYDRNTMVVTAKGADAAWIVEALRDVLLNKMDNKGNMSIN